MDTKNNSFSRTIIKQALSQQQQKAVNIASYVIKYYSVH